MSAPVFLRKPPVVIVYNSAKMAGNKLFSVDNFVHNVDYF